MSRTPLFRTLRRSFRLAQRSVATGTPPDAVVEEWREAAKLSRRQFLGGTAAAAGLAMVGCRPFAGSGAGSGGGSGVSSGGRIVVVGAGISGLTAGYRLHQQGADVRILEGQDRVGGRMYSQRGFFPGQVAELGGELIDTGHVHMRQLAEELEIPLDDFALDGVGLDRDVLFFDGRRIQEHEVVEAFVPLSRRMVWDLAALSGEGVSFREPNGGEKLDRTPLSEWLAGVETPPWFRKLLDVAYTTEYGLETAEQSALNFLLLMDPNPIPFRIFSASDERFHVRSGNDSIPRALAKRLVNRVEMSSQVEAVSKRSDGTFALSVRRDGTSETVTADHVVFTVPFTLLRPRQDGGPWIRLDDSLGIPEVQKKAIRELGYGTNSKLMVGFAKRLWRQPELPYRSIGSTLTDLPYQLCWETSRLQRGETGILTNFTGGRHGLELGDRTPEERAEVFAREVDRVFPGIAEARLPDLQSRFIWPTFPWTLGSYSCYRPGQWTAFGGEEGRRVGNLHFAGEHTSGTAAGFMEGGCESGHRAAGEILEGRAGAEMPGRLRRVG